MKAVVSHLAWSAEEEQQAWELAARLGFKVGEVAPGRCWSRESLLEWACGEASEPPGWNRPAIEGWRVAGFQAILFGFPDWQIFSETTAPLMAGYLKGLARLLGCEGGLYLVFGAPKNRLRPEGMSAAEARDKAVAFFSPLAQAADRGGVFFAFEANPAAYGGNFAQTSVEAIELVRAVNHPGLRWHLDTGELAMNGHDGVSAAEVVRAGADVLGSVHVSEPFLGDFREPWPGHGAVAGALREIGYAGTVSLEMKAPEGGLDQVQRALEFLQTVYGVD
jgi:hypothetical protein